MELGAFRGRFLLLPATRPTKCTCGGLVDVLLTAQVGPRPFSYGYLPLQPTGRSVRHSLQSSDASSPKKKRVQTPEHDGFPV